MLSTKHWGEGTIGISGWTGEEEGYYWVGNLEIKYYCLKTLDRVIGLFDFGLGYLKGVPGLSLMWIRFGVGPNLFKRDMGLCCLSLALDQEMIEVDLGFNLSFKDQRCKT